MRASYPSLYALGPRWPDPGNPPRLSAGSCTKGFRGQDPCALESVCKDGAVIVVRAVGTRSHVPIRDVPPLTVDAKPAIGVLRDDGSVAPLERVAHFDNDLADKHRRGLFIRTGGRDLLTDKKRDGLAITSESCGPSTNEA